MKQNFKKYPLLSNAFTNEDINKGIKVIKSKNITMSKITLKFEKKFARKMGVKYALMTNSGSSANLLVISALINPLNKKKLNKNDEILIPAVCWSTTLWPIIQNNLKPVFVDVDLDTFNIDIKNLEKKISKKTKAIMLIHVLGTCSNMSKLMQIAKKNKLIVIEDTCESLGAKFNKKLLGTFGKFGTFSFYYSHQITSG
jgi:CDP-6-deoxy-D-xylo-4-hexulose-3-dehydrase